MGFIVLLGMKNTSAAFVELENGLQESNPAAKFSILETFEKAETIGKEFSETIGEGISLKPINPDAELLLQSESDQNFQEELPSQDDISTGSESFQDTNILRNVPLTFEKNSGQLQDEEIKYFTRKDQSQVYFYDNEVKIHLNNEESQAEIGFSFKTQTENTTNLSLMAEDRTITKTNYFIGNDESQYISNNPTFDKVTYENLYKGVSATYYTTAQDLKYDINIQPHTTDPNKIEIQVSGADQIYVNEEGDLTIETAVGDIYDQSLNVYQVIDGQIITVPASFRVTSQSSYGFTIGEYNLDYPLTVDPLVYSTYLGGDGAEAITDIKVDANGNTYVAGTTSDKTNFPGPGTNFPGPGSGSSFGTQLGDISFVSKLNNDYTGLDFTTYIGGSGPLRLLAFELDSSGNTYIAGVTDSNDYPMLNALDNTFGGADEAFLSKINSDGSALVYSTYIGGDGSDYINGIDLDSSNNVYISGTTSSSDLAATAGVIDGSHNGGTDAFVAKINSAGNAYDYLTYLTGDVGATVLAESGKIIVDNSGNAYISGVTTSANFPTTVGSFNTVHSGANDIYVCKINSDASNLIYSSFLGGSNNESVGDIALTSSDQLVVGGQTFSNDYQTIGSSYDTNFSGVSDGFLTIISAAGDSLVKSTFVGGNQTDIVNSIDVDVDDEIYLIGTTNSAGWTVQTPGAFQSNAQGGNDAFLIRFNSSLNKVKYYTFIGSLANESGVALSLDANKLADNVWVAGELLNAIPGIGVGGFQNVPGVPEDGFLAKIRAVSRYLVNSNLDTIDSNIGDKICDDGAGNCTLRAAIQESLDSVGLLEHIEFDNAYTINIGANLPTMDGQVYIDGTSMPAYIDTPLIVIDGPGGGTGLSLGINAQGSKFLALEILDFNTGISIGAPVGFAASIPILIKYNNIHNNLNIGINVNGLVIMTISENSIYDNTNLGIDLSGYQEWGFFGIDNFNFVGSSWNDATDADWGPNHMQNFPYIISATYDGGANETTITGRLISIDNEPYTLEFFSNADPGDATLGEGQIYLGSQILNLPNGDNDEPFTFVVSGDYSASYLTSTATDSNGRTSEFGGNYNSRYSQVSSTQSPAYKIELDATLDANYDYSFIFSDQTDGKEYYFDSVTLSLIECLDQVECLDATKFNDTNFSEVSTGLNNLYTVNPSYILKMNRYSDYSQYATSLGIAQNILPEYIYFTVDDNFTVTPEDNIEFGDNLYIQASQTRLDSNGNLDSIQARITTVSGDSEEITLTEVMEMMLI